MTRLAALFSSFVLLGAVLYMLSATYTDPELDVQIRATDQVLARVEALQQRQAAGNKPSADEVRSALDEVARPEPVLADLRGGDVDVVRTAPVAGDADEGVAVGQVDEAGHRDGGRSLLNLNRRFMDCCCHG